MPYFCAFVAWNMFNYSSPRYGPISHNMLQINIYHIEWHQWCSQLIALQPCCSLLCHRKLPGQISSCLVFTPRFKLGKKLTDELACVTRKGKLSDTEHAIWFQLNISTHVPMCTRKYKVTYYSCLCANLLRRSSEKIKEMERRHLDWYRNGAPRLVRRQLLYMIWYSFCCTISNSRVCTPISTLTYGLYNLIVNKGKKKEKSL
jgi:hypothetical protein